MCIATLGCSAFKFDKETGSCDLGSKAHLLIPQQKDSPQQHTEVTINTAGKHKIDINIKIASFKGKPI